MRKMVFIGGIHGVGKTSLCNILASIFGINTYSASKIISNRKQEIMSLNKRIDQINENQDYLLDGLHNLKIGDEWYLLDGHFTLINKFGVITEIPKETYKNLSPKAIVVIADKVQDISSRLKERDKINYDFEFLEEFQRKELFYSNLISSKLNIPYLVHYNWNDPEILYHFLNDTIKD